MSTQNSVPPTTTAVAAAENTIPPTLFEGLKKTENGGISDGLREFIF